MFLIILQRWHGSSSKDLQAVLVVNSMSVQFLLPHFLIPSKDPEAPLLTIAMLASCRYQPFETIEADRRPGVQWDRIVPRRPPRDVELLGVLLQVRE